MDTHTESKIRAHLDRVLASARFREAPRISAFLRNVVEKTLAGRQDEVKEIFIGMEVYDRGPDFNPATDSIVRVEASRLRSKLRDYYLEEGKDTAVRITLPKGTYVPVFELPGQAPVVTAAGPRRNWQWPAILGVVLLGVVAAGFWFARRPGAAPRLAVLPFEDLSEGREQAYFCDGLAEELIDDLSRIPGLAVLARGSSFQFRGPGVDLRDAGRKLRVDRILAGSVRRSGTQVRVTAQLVDAGSGVTLWSGTFDRESRDVLALQDQIAAEVARRLLVEIARKTPGPRRGDPEAHNLYLQGRYHYWKSTAEEEAKALRFFEEAVARDPNFAPAHAGIADVLASRPLRGLEQDRAAVERAKESARRAVELDPRLIDGRLAQAHIARTLLYDWGAAERLYRECIAQQPGAARPHNSYGVLLSLMGRFVDADRELREALRLDPLSMQVNTNLALNLYRQRRFEAAIEQAKQGAAIDPNYRNLYSVMAAAQAELGRYPEAVATLEVAKQKGGGRLTDNHLALLGHVYGRAGDRAKAMEVLAELERRAQERYVPRAALADVYLGLGENDRALGLMEEALQAREVLLAGLLVSPHADKVRLSLKFRGLQQRVARRG